MTRTWLVIACFGGWACGGDEERKEAILDLDPDLDNGADVYAASCEECHGADGSAFADGSFQLAGKDLRGFDQEHIVDTILDPPSGMLDFTSLSDQEIADVSAYAESL